jgi:hypothetical protein
MVVCGLNVVSIGEPPAALLTIEICERTSLTLHLDQSTETSRSTLAGTLRFRRQTGFKKQIRL